CLYSSGRYHRDLHSFPTRRSSDLENFRMPAEWEQHEATWIGWPHNFSDWPGKIFPIPWVYGEMVRKISVGEKVRIVVENEEHHRSEEHTSELQSRENLVCRLLLEK